MIERGIVKTVKSAKKIVDRKEPISLGYFRKRIERTSCIT
jgi:hypothetical protein